MMMTDLGCLVDVMVGLSARCSPGLSNTLR
jgi:hypothetical protein